MGGGDGCLPQQQQRAIPSTRRVRVKRNGGKRRDGEEGRAGKAGTEREGRADRGSPGGEIDPGWPDPKDSYRYGRPRLATSCRGCQSWE